MEKNWIAYIFILLIAIVGASCSELEPNFDLNNDDLTASKVEPVDYKDSTKVMRVFPTDKIILTDISSKKAQTRYWDTNDDGEWDAEYQDREHLEITFEEEGFHKITFCANTEKNCVTKWVYVLSSIGDEIEEETSVLTFISPSGSYIETDARSYNIEVATVDVFSKEELNVLVNGEAFTDFDFDMESGTLSAKISGLKRGKETAIEVQANTTDGTASEMVTIMRNDPDKKEDIAETPINPRPQPTPKPTPRPVPTPSIQAQPPVVIFTGAKDFKSESAGVIVQTEKVRQNDLSFTLNGKKVNFSKVRSYSGSLANKTDWQLNLKLKEGKNRLAYQAKNKNGATPGEVLLNYTKPKPTRPKALSQSTTVGISGSQHNGFSKDCIALYTKDQFEVLLLPNQKVELQSFKVFTNVCGGLKVTLEGDGDEQSFKTILNAGGSTINFTPIDTELAAHQTYTLKLEPLGNYKSCNASSAPRFEKITDCKANSKNHAALKLQQNQNPILYDLKIKF